MTITETPTRKTIRLSEPAETWLLDAAGKLQAGELELWQFPRGIYEFVLFGWATGYSSREREVARANHDADRFYRAAFDDKVTEPANYMTFEKLENLREEMYRGTVRS